MQQKEMNVELRDCAGKGVSRKIRAAGFVPGVVYGKGIEPVAVTVAPKELLAAMAGEGGHNNLITLKGGGSLAGNVVIVADVQYDALRRFPCHVDLHKINMAEKVRVRVPVNLKGTAAGVKDGGMLDFAMHEIEVECLPGQIPEHIDVDVTALTVGHSIHVSEVTFPAGLKVLEDSKASIVSILGKTKETEAAEGEQA